MRVVVMGAGLAGVTSAWYLAKAGHEVAVIDREPEVASVASFSNGGIIAASRAYPWPATGLRKAILDSIFRLDPELWRWGLQHLALRGDRAYRAILDAKVRLVRYAQAQVEALARETGIEYERRSGVLYIYRDEAELEAGWQRSATMRELGIDLRRLEPSHLAALDPALSLDGVSGALHAPQDASGDPALFCRQLAERCRALGVQFYLECDVTGVQAVDVSISEVITHRGRVKGDAFVCALGVIAPKLRERLGTSVPVYPVRGCSATIPFTPSAARPRHGGIDESAAISYCRMGETLRVTGGAQFVGYANDADPREAERLYAAAKRLFPEGLDFAHARSRTCLRPMTPETTPRFGTGRYANLWYNVGLGHMGFTMAAGAGRITADLVSGRKPEIDLEGLRIKRY